MRKIDGFEETQDVAVTVVVDNRADLLVKSSDAVKYYTDAPLLAEHGFAAVVTLKGAGVTILWDAGGTKIALPENLNRLKLDPKMIDAFALSHGHWDHTASVTDVLKMMDLLPKPKLWDQDAAPDAMQAWAEGHRVPIIVHPAAFRERWGVRKDGKKFGPILPPSRAAWEAYGGQVILSDGPYQLGPGCWSTGQIPRLSFEKTGMSSSAIYRQGETFSPDYVDDDQAIIINVKDKGLLIVTGCAHSGIVNTLNCAREISGVDRICGIVGGFHLAASSDAEINQTIAVIKAMNPAMIAPSHCTGFRAISQFADQMTEQFVIGVVGATYCF